MAAARKVAETPEKIADDFTSEEIAERLEQTLGHVEAIRALWPGTVRLPDDHRRTSIGRVIAQLSPPLRRLFVALSPKEGESEQTRKAKKKLSEIFDTLLGGQDFGRDDARFEADLLLRRLERLEAEQKVLEALEDAARHFGDDVLNTGELVLGPGLQAVEVARTASGNNAEFRTLLSPVLSALGEMTKRARQAQETARKGKGKAKKDEEAAKGEEGGKGAKGAAGGEK